MKPIFKYDQKAFAKIFDRVLAKARDKDVKYVEVTGIYFWDSCMQERVNISVVLDKSVKKIPHFGKSPVSVPLVAKRKSIETAVWKAIDSVMANADIPLTEMEGFSQCAKDITVKLAHWSAVISVSKAQKSDCGSNEFRKQAFDGLRQLLDDRVMYALEADEELCAVCEVLNALEYTGMVTPDFLHELNDAHSRLPTNVVTALKALKFEQIDVPSLSSGFDALEKYVDYVNDTGAGCVEITL